MYFDIFFSFSSNTESVYSVKMEMVSSKGPSEIQMLRLSEGENLIESPAFSTSKTECFERLEQSGHKRTEITVKHVIQNVDRSVLVQDLESVSSSSLVSKRSMDATVGSYLPENQTDRTSRANEKLSPNRQPRFV